MKQMLFGTLLLLSGNVFAENLQDQIPTPKTKLEVFSATTGVVLVRGFEKIATVSGLYNTSIEVEAKEFVNVSTNLKQYGITIEVRESKSGYTKDNTSYIDFEEISGLLNGIDYIAKVDNSATKFSNFQADFATKGDLKFSTFSVGDKVMFSIESGNIGRVQSFFNMESLPSIRNAIAQAKTKIETLRAN